MEGGPLLIVYLGGCFEVRWLELVGRGRWLIAMKKEALFPLSIRPTTVSFLFLGANLHTHTTHTDDK